MIRKGNWPLAATLVRHLQFIFPEYKMETTGEKKQDFILTVAKDLVLKMFLLWRGKFRGEQARYSRLPAMD